MTYKDFKQYCISTKPDHLRFGQHLFNELCNINLDLANEIRGTALDPFFLDDIILKLEEFLEENWERKFTYDD